MVASREGIAAAVLLVALVVVYAPVVHALIRVWITVPSYSYGILLPLFSLWLMWDAREALRAAWVTRPPLRISRASLALAIAAVTALVAGAGTHSVTLGIVSLPLLLTAIARAVLGVAGSRPLTFPLAFLVLMAPLPDSAVPRISLALQSLAAVCAAGLLGLIGIPVHRDGLFLHLDPVIVHVSEACSGLRFLLAMTVIGVALAWATQRTHLGRVTVVVLAVLTALAANTVRVAVTGVAAQLFGPSAATGTVHVLYGKLVYLAALGAFVPVVLVLRRRLPSSSARRP